MTRGFARPRHYYVRLIAPLRRLEFDTIIDVETDATLMNPAVWYRWDEYVYSLGGSNVLGLYAKVSCSESNLLTSAVRNVHVMEL
jgi:hypothetical protein